MPLRSQPRGRRARRAPRPAVDAEAGRHSSPGGGTDAELGHLTPKMDQKSLTTPLKSERVISSAGPSPSSSSLSMASGRLIMRALGCLLGISLATGAALRDVAPEMTKGLHSAAPAASGRVQQASSGMSAGHAGCEMNWGGVDIDFSRACETGEPANNNLGGLGPGDGDHVIRYADVGTVDNQRVDLVVRAVNTYVSNRAHLRNGCKNPGRKYGVIHVQVRRAIGGQACMRDQTSTVLTDTRCRALASRSLHPRRALSPGPRRTLAVPSPRAPHLAYRRRATMWTSRLASRRPRASL